MKKLVLFLITITALTFAGCAKTEIPEFSDEYLVGVDYGGATYGEYYECIGAMVIVCENREVLVKMPTPKAAYYRTGEEEVIATFTISEDQYATIDSIVNQKKLYKMVVKSDSSACDAPSYYLYLYDKDENILKAVGAYMPISQKFMNIYKGVVNNIPGEEISEAMSVQIERYKEYSEEMRR